MNADIENAYIELDKNKHHNMYKYGINIFCQLLSNNDFELMCNDFLLKHKVGYDYQFLATESLTIKQ